MTHPTFLICSTPDSPETEKKILEVFGPKGEDNFYCIREGSQWLVSTDRTTQQVYEAIEIDRKDNNAGVAVFSILNHWGHHNKDMWEWLALD